MKDKDSKIQFEGWVANKKLGKLLEQAETRKILISLCGEGTYEVTKLLKKYYDYIGEEGKSEQEEKFKKVNWEEDFNKQQQEHEEEIEIEERRLREKAVDILMSLEASKLEAAVDLLEELDLGMRHRDRS